MDVPVTNSSNIEKEVVVIDSSDNECENDSELEDCQMPSAHALGHCIM